MTNKAFWQAIRYITVFLVSNLPFYVYFAYDIKWAYPPLAAGYIYVIVWPLFGVSNAFVYFRPRYLSYRDKNREKRWIQCVFYVLDVDLGSPTWFSTTWFSTTWFSSRSDESDVPPTVSELIDEDDLESPLFQEENSSHNGGESL